MSPAVEAYFDAKPDPLFDKIVKQGTQKRYNEALDELMKRHVSRRLDRMNYSAADPKVPRPLDRYPCMKRKSVVVIVADLKARLYLTDLLESAGFAVRAFAEPFSALTFVQEAKPDVIVRDDRPAALDGAAPCPVLVVAARKSVESGPFLGAVRECAGRPRGPRAR